MKRLFLVIAVALIICFTGCSTSADATLSFTNYEGNILNMNNRPYHLIDNITGVVYVVVPSSHGVAITPAYNPDGSLLTKKQLEVEE